MTKKIMDNNKVNNVVEVDASYDEFINNLAKNSDSATFTNGSEVHALSILRAIFKYSSKYIYMLSNQLDPIVFSDRTLIDEAKEFLNKEDSVLHIAVQDGNFSIADSIFVSELQQNYGEKIKVMKALPNGKVQSLPVNFTIADDKAYRLENDLGKKTAFGCFSDAETTNMLKKLFNSIFNENQMSVVSD